MFHDVLLFFHVLTHDGFLQKRHGPALWFTREDPGHGPDLSLVSFIVCRCAVDSVRHFPQLHARQGVLVPNGRMLGMALVLGMAFVFWRFVSSLADTSL